MENNICSHHNCELAPTIMCYDCHDRDSDGKLQDNLVFCQAHFDGIHLTFIHHKYVLLQDMGHKEDVLLFHEQQIRHLRKLELVKGEIDLMTSDLKMQKELNTRHIKLIVADLQQTILTRGKALAKQVNARYDEQTAKVLNVKQQVEEAVNSVIKKITEVDKVKNLTGDEFQHEYARLKGENVFDKAAYGIDVPKASPMLTLDTTSLNNALRELSITEAESQEIEKSDLPALEWQEGKTLDMLCSDLWWVTKSYFSMFPVRADIVAALENLSVRVRQRYIEDVDWQCYKDLDQEPEVGGRVFVRLSATIKQWCRAQILSNFTTKKQSEVYLLDWGQTVHEVCWSDILPYKDDFTSQEPVAIKCVIDECVDPNQAREAKWTFNDCVKNFSSSCIPLQVTLQKQVMVGDKLVWKVDICGTPPGGDVIDISQVFRAKLDAGANTSSIRCRDIREEFAPIISNAMDTTQSQQNNSNTTQKSETITNDVTKGNDIVKKTKHPIPSMMPKSVSVSLPVVKPFLNPDNSDLISNDNPNAICGGESKTSDGTAVTKQLLISSSGDEHHACMNEFQTE